jgi:DNA-binding transcriptional MerR regulator
MRPNEVAKLTGLPLSTLQNWRDSGLAPANSPHKQNNPVIYDRQALRRVRIAESLRARGFSPKRIKKVIDILARSVSRYAVVFCSPTYWGGTRTQGVKFPVNNEQALLLAARHRGPVFLLELPR